MSIERARAVLHQRPWGIPAESLRPRRPDAIGLIGEIWFETAIEQVVPPALLLKRLFTAQPLSIQVHPDDAMARAMGLPRGKTEAWYIQSAGPGARIGLGLNAPVQPRELMTAILDGSVVDLLNWRSVTPGDTVSVPAGTIHAIGANLIVAEIQQQSDTTFRLYDYGRGRELHVDQGIEAYLPDSQPEIRSKAEFSDDRVQLLSNSHFTMDRIDVLASANWTVSAGAELWLLVIGGNGQIGAFGVSEGDCAFLSAVEDVIVSTSAGLSLIAAYPAGSMAVFERVSKAGLNCLCMPVNTTGISS